MKILIFLSLLGALLGCVEKEFDPNDPQKSFSIAKEPYDDESYEIAINKLSEFRARFPYSQYAVEAELLIANSHFQLGQYPEAAASYEQFAKLHPKHAKVEFALFRVGQSYWQEAPEEIDREQSLTEKALEAWSRLLQLFPKGTHAAEAKKLIAEGRERIARSQEFVVNFYCKQEIYHACAYRALKLAEDYPGMVGLRRWALSKGAESFKELAKQKEKDPDSDKNIYFRSMTAQQLREKASELEALSKK